MQDLVTHNEAMQRELTEVHSLLDDGTDPEVHGECCPACLQSSSGASSGWLADQELPSRLPSSQVQPHLDVFEVRQDSRSAHSLHQQGHAPTTCLA